MFARSCLILSITLLAACDRDEEPARVSISAGDTTSAAAPSQGASFKIDTEGFKADIQIPGLTGLSDKIKIDGVRLYPESRVASVNVMETSGADNFSMQFDAPASVARVRDWYAKQFAHNSFAARPTLTGFEGTTGDGDRFELELTGTPDGHTFGEFKLGRRP